MESYKAEVGKILGFYDFSSSPVIIHPQQVDNQHPGISEVHEKVHYELGTSTTYGFFQRMLKLIHEKLFNSPQEQIEYANLFSLFLEMAFKVHEGSASYQSLIMYHDIDASISSYKKMPQSYKKAVSMFETLLPSILDREHTGAGSIAAADLCNWISRSALNGPILKLLIMPDKLTDVSIILEDISPDLRLEKILAGLKNTNLIMQWQEDILTIWQDNIGKVSDSSKLYKADYDKLSYENFLEKYQQYIDNVDRYLGRQLEIALPTIEICNSDSERWKESEIFFESWKMFFKDNDLNYLNDQDYESSKNKKTVERTESAINVKVQSGNDIADTIIDNFWFLKYRRIEFNQIKDEILKISLNKDQLLIVAVYVHLGSSSISVLDGQSLAQDDYLFLSLRLALSKENKSDQETFATVVPKNKTQQVIEIYEKGNVVWKVDGRILNAALDKETIIPKFSAPLFIISESEDYQYICSDIEKFIIDGKQVFLILQKIGGQSNLDRSSTDICILCDRNKIKFKMYRITSTNWHFLKLKYSRRKDVIILDGSSKANFEVYKMEFGFMRSALFMVPQFTYGIF